MLSRFVRDREQRQLAPIRLWLLTTIVRCDPRAVLRYDLMANPAALRNAQRGNPAGGDIVRCHASQPRVSPADLRQAPGPGCTPLHGAFPCRRTQIAPGRPSP